MRANGLTRLWELGGADCSRLRLKPPQPTAAGAQEYGPSQGHPSSQRVIGGESKVGRVDFESIQKQRNTPLKADHPERPTITLGWSLAHPRGILENDVFLLDFMASRSGWHRNRGVFSCSQARLEFSTTAFGIHLFQQTA